LLEPEILAGLHVTAQVDNATCVNSFEIGQLANGFDSLSILFRTAKLIAAYLRTVLHIEHLARQSSWESELVDNISRKTTTGFFEQRALHRFPRRNLPIAHLEWF
jgi:hypothetical protein